MCSSAVVQDLSDALKYESNRLNGSLEDEKFMPNLLFVYAKHKFNIFLPFRTKGRIIIVN